MITYANEFTKRLELSFFFFYNSQKIYVWRKNSSAFAPIYLIIS